MIGVVGLGYVGLTTALAFCERGYRVWGYDRDPQKREKLRRKELFFHEPFLQEMLARANALMTAESLHDLLSQSELVFFCVGTPLDGVERMDLSQLLSAVEASLIFYTESRDAPPRKTIVIKSTVPPGTTRDRIKPLFERYHVRIGEDVGLAVNPEFLRQGKAWEDVIKPDRIVIGADDPLSRQAVGSVWEGFGAPVRYVNTTTAEFIKFLSNAYLAANISLANELATIAQLIGDVDHWKAFEIFYTDRRWSGQPASMSRYFWPGCGFGGSCLPKDVAAFIETARRQGYEPSLLRSVLEVNAHVKNVLINKVAGSVHRDEWIAVLGLSFKPDTDDVRHSPAADLIALLLEKNYHRIIVHDPIATENFMKTYGYPVEVADNAHDAVRKADAVLIVTPWKGFRSLSSSLRGKKVFDCRGFFHG